MKKALNSTLLQEFDNEGMPRSGLPSVAYTSDSFLELENSYLFSMNWVFVGFAHKISRAGDVIPVSVAGQPILSSQKRSE